MRWIDIALPQPENRQDVDLLIHEAQALAAEIPAIQDRDGLDSITVMDRMKTVGRLLFQAVVAGDPEAFHPSADQPGARTPDLGSQRHDDLVGYHLVTGPQWANLPWNWLHNGLAFLVEKNPVCVSGASSIAPRDTAQRPWMQRMLRAGFLVGEEGSTGLRATFAQMREGSPGPCDLLFVPGHTEEQIRRLIYREAEAIESAFGTSALAGELVRMSVPAGALTPSQLREQGLTYQAIHFAGPTSQPARAGDTAGEAWMTRLIEETAAPADEELADTLGLEGEVLGVDPVTSLLDDISERADRNADQTACAASRDAGNRAYADGGGRGVSDRGTPKNSGGWLLEDGPVEPEAIEKGGGIPPLVFSNSHQALPELGRRFTAAGASTFVGPVIPLFSRPARIFAGHFYGALGEGWCAGAAVWRAALACRQELGRDHPAWLSYGIHGYGTLALQYL